MVNIERELQMRLSFFLNNPKIFVLLHFYYYFCTVKQIKQTMDYGK